MAIGLNTREPSSGLQNFAIAITFFFPAVALLVVAARVAGRMASRQFGLDDWFISVSMLLSIVQTGISYMFIKINYIGIHIDQVPPHDLTTSMIWNFAVEFLYNPILALAKSSVLIFLLRLFGQKTGIRRFIVGLNIVNLMQMTALLVALIFQCTPIAFNWDPTIRGGRCIDRRALFVSTSAINIVTDLVVLGLPMYILADLKIRRRTKVGLIFIFLLGILVTITSIVRMVLFVQGLFNLVVMPDPTFNIGFVASAIETNLALITASIPALRPFLRARDRGGWLPRFGRTEREAGRNTAVYMSRTSTAATAKKSTTSLPSSGFRGPSRSGSKGSKSKRTKQRPPALHNIRIQTLDQQSQHARRDMRELHGHTPRRSSEEAMTSNGIMRVSDIQREVDGLARELTAVSGPLRASFLDTDPVELQRRPRQSSEQRRDFNEERLSRYGERRFGVVTPRGVPAQWPGRDRPSMDEPRGSTDITDGRPF